MTPTFDINADGNLVVTLTDADDRADLVDLLRDKSGTYADIWTAMCESEMCNGGFHPFDAGGGSPFVGLTGAQCIAESMTHDDDGTPEISGRWWYLADYMTRDELRDLVTGESVLFTLGGKETPKDDTTNPSSLAVQIGPVTMRATLVRHNAAQYHLNDPANPAHAPARAWHSKESARRDLAAVAKVYAACNDGLFMIHPDTPTTATTLTAALAVVCDGVTS